VVCCTIDVTLQWFRVESSSSSSLSSPRSDSPPRVSPPLHSHSSCVLCFVVVVVVIVCSLRVLAMSTVEQQLQQQLAASQQQNMEQAAQLQQAAQAVQAMQIMQAELQQLRAAQQSMLPLPLSSASSSSSSSSAVQAGPSMGRIDLKPMQPSSFNGTASSNADQWLMEMERYFAVVLLSEVDARRVPFASTFLKDSASTWYTSIVTELGGAPNWTEFKQRFLQRFRPLAASRMARAAIRNLKQRFKVASYSAEFQKQLQHISDMSVADQIEFYISGLQSHLAMEVDRDAPKTLAAAMESAQRIELMLASRRGTASFGRSRHFAPSSSYHHGGGARGDDMDLSALLGQGTTQEEQSEPADGQQPDPASILLRLAAMFQRGGGRGGRPGGRGGGNAGRGGRNARQVSNLSQEDYDRLSREGKCFRCKLTGHLARNCPTSDASSGQASSSSASLN